MIINEYQRARTEFILFKIQTTVKQIMRVFSKLNDEDLANILLLLSKQAESFYSFSNSEGLESLHDNANQIIGIIIKIKEQLKNAERLNIQLYLERILTLVEQNKATIPKRILSPSEMILTYSLAVILAAYKYSQQSASQRVAAILVTKQHQRIFAGNPEETILSPRHAEVNSLIEAKRAKIPFETAILFVSVQPCYYENMYQLTKKTDFRNKKEIIEGIPVMQKRQRILEKNNIQKKIWTRSLRSTNNIWTDSAYNLQIYELFINANNSEVFYLIDGIWIPRELRTYETIKGTLYLTIKTGCAVTIALSNIKEIYYVSPLPAYNKINTFFEEHKISINQIIDRDINSIAHCALNGMHGNISKERVIQNMDLSFDNISKRLHIPDIKEFLASSFKELREL